MSEKNFKMGRHGHIWVLGNAVQDVTVEVDIDRLQHEHPNVQEFIRLERVPRVKRGLRFNTSVGTNRFAVEMQFDENPSDADFYDLAPGGKYTLTGDVFESAGEECNNQPAVFVPCEDLSWGGGGINLIRFLRSLAPSQVRVPVTYTDIAMSDTLSTVLQDLQNLYGDLAVKKSELGEVIQDQTTEIRERFKGNPQSAETLAARAAKIAARYTPDRSLEVFISSLPGEFMMYRPFGPRFRRNWVFSRFRSHTTVFDNKVVCRGRQQPLTSVDEQAINQLLAPRVNDVGVVVLDSIKDEAMFQAGYEFCKLAHRKGNSVVSILAWTDSMLPFADWLMKQREDAGDECLSCILIVNETEAFKLAHRFDPNLEQFMDDASDIPDMRKFARIAETLRWKFRTGQRRCERIYVTIGPRGSLGVDGPTGKIVYVASYTKREGRIYDTNACGDAYAAGIVLLEWAKRNGYPKIGGADFNRESDACVKEMRYFMAVATAAAYSKATNPRGRVDLTEVRDLLGHQHLATSVLSTAQQIASGEPSPFVRGTKLDLPKTANSMAITDDLAKIMSIT